MAASLGVWRTRLVECRVRADRTLSPLTLAPGHGPSLDQKCLTLLKRCWSGPISDRIVSAEVTARPLTRVRSPPDQRANAVLRGIRLRARRGF